MHATGRRKRLSLTPLKQWLYPHYTQWLPGTLNSSMGHSSHGGQELCVGHSSGSGDEGSGGLSVIDGHSEHSLGQGLLVIRGQVGVGQEGQVGQGKGVAAGEQVTGGGARWTLWCGWSQHWSGRWVLT